MNQREKSHQTKRKVKQGRKKTGTILQSPNLTSKVLFSIFFVFKDHSLQIQPGDLIEQ